MSVIINRRTYLSTRLPFCKHHAPLLAARSIQKYSDNGFPSHHPARFYASVSVVSGSQRDKLSEHMSRQPGIGSYPGLTQDTGYPDRPAFSSQSNRKPIRYFCICNTDVGCSAVTAGACTLPSCRSMTLCRMRVRFREETIWPYAMPSYTHVAFIHTNDHTTRRFTRQSITFASIAPGTNIQTANGTIAIRLVG